MSSEQPTVADRVRKVVAECLNWEAGIEFAIDHERDRSAKPKSFRLFRPPRPQMPEEKRITPDRITDDRPLYQDLDSMSVEELIMAFEDEFDLRIPDGDAAEFHTVGDAIRYLEDRVKLPAEG
jgi:acyl carrier protein